jgi:hypothetical protein
LKADKKLFRLLTLAGLASGTGGGCGIFFAAAVAEVVTVERRFAVFAGSCGKARGGDWDFDLLREGARADLGGLSRYAGLVLSVGDARGGVIELLVGMVLLRVTISDLEDLCFLESDDFMVGAGAPSSLPRRGRGLISELGWIGRPPTVFGLPKGVLVPDPSRSPLEMPLSRKPSNSAGVDGVPCEVDGRSSSLLG